MLQFFHWLVQTDPLLRLPVTLNTSLPVSFVSGNTDLAPGAKEQLNLSCFRTTVWCFPCKCCGWFPQFVLCLHQFCNPSVCRRTVSSTLQTGQPAACFVWFCFSGCHLSRRAILSFYFHVSDSSLSIAPHECSVLDATFPLVFHRAGHQTKGPGLVLVYEKHNTEGEHLKNSVLQHLALLPALLKVTWNLLSMKLFQYNI